jgi:hypothetical protein
MSAKWRPRGRSQPLASPSSPPLASPSSPTRCWPIYHTPARRSRTERRPGISREAGQRWWPRSGPPTPGASSASSSTQAPPPHIVAGAAASSLGANGSDPPGPDQAQAPPEPACRTSQPGKTQAPRDRTQLRATIHRSNAATHRQTPRRSAAAPLHAKRSREEPAPPCPPPSAAGRRHNSRRWPEGLEI